MLDFECPSCQARCQIADAYAGKSVVCPQCARTATLPLRDDAATAVTTPDVVEAAEQAKARDHYDKVERDTFSIAKDGGASWTLMQRCGCVGLGILIVLAVIALLVPSVRRVGGLSARTQAINNLKQIGLAAHSFHDAHKRLPFNGTRPAVANDFTSGSWAFQILPFIDQGPLFANPQPPPDADVWAYRCPSRGGAQANAGTGPVTDYVLNIYLNTRTIGNGWNAADSGLKLVDIADGTSNTVFAGQGWLSPNDYKKAVIPGQRNSIFLGGVADLARGGMDVPAKGIGPAAVLQRDTDEVPAGAAFVPWGGPFPQGAVVGMADGTVRIFPYTMSGQTFGAFLTPSNDEAAVLPD